MAEEKTEEKTTIGEAAGLVPSAKLAEVEDARLKEAAANAKLREDLEARDATIATLKENIIELARDSAIFIKARDYAESECVKAKGTEVGHKREIARLETANTALSQEVDQLRGKGSELWESLTTSNKMRDEAVKRSAALQVEMDEVQVGADKAREEADSIINSLSITSDVWMAVGRAATPAVAFTDAVKWLEEHGHKVDLEKRCIYYPAENPPAKEVDDAIAELETFVDTGPDDL